MEKCFAKIFGSYSNIEKGLGSEALNALTGAPSITIFTESKTFKEDLLKYA